MSNLIFNLRVGYWHIQITRWPWKPSISSNRAFWEKRGIRPEPFIQRYL